MRYELYSFNNNSAFGITSIGYSDDASITRFGPSQRNNYIIHYVLSGQGYFNGKLLGGGQGFLITPHMQEHYYPNKYAPWEFLWILADNIPYFETIFKEYNADPQTNIFEYNNIPFLIQAKNIIVNNNNKIYCSSELSEMFLHIFNNHNITVKNEASAEAMYFNYAIKFINSNIFRKITVEELVSILGISQPYLYNIFKKNSSVSPKQYIDMQKIEKAKELLTDTSMQLTEVAGSIGIDDCITFSKYFKKRTGLSPSEYRQRSK